MRILRNIKRGIKSKYKTLKIEDQSYFHNLQTNFSNDPNTEIDENFSELAFNVP